MFGSVKNALGMGSKGKSPDKPSTSPTTKAKSQEKASGSTKGKSQEKVAESASTKKHSENKIVDKPDAENLARRNSEKPARPEKPERKASTKSLGDKPSDPAADPSADKPLKPPPQRPPPPPTNTSQAPAQVGVVKVTFTDDEEDVEDDEGKMNKQSNSKKQATTHAQNNTLLTDSKNYRETLQTYLRYMHQLYPQREWMKYKFGLRIRDILDAKKDIKILAVGTGSGEVDIDFLNEIVRCGKERLGETGYSVVYQVVEPNSSNVDHFRNTVKQNSAYNRIEFKWFTGTYEKFCDDFRSRETEENKYDFVHFVRCFYHIDSTKAFDQTYNHLLAKNGIMCGIGENENAFWPKMMQFLADHKMEHECFTCSGPVSQNYFLPGWIKLCYQRDWRYESYVQGYNFDITPLYDETSKDGNYLLDFAMHAKNARKTIKRTILDDFFKLLDKDKREVKVIENGVETTKIYFPCELGAMMITKE